MATMVAPIKSFPYESRPERMHHCDRRFGLLSNIQQDDECIIATIGEDLVVLPEDLKSQLEPLLGRRIGLANFFDEFSLRLLEAA